MYWCYSIFDDNYGADGASVSLIYSTGSFNNVTFSNHKGPVLRVSNKLCIYSGIICENKRDALEV